MRNPAFDTFFSHPGKPLWVHIEGVLDGVKRHTKSPVAYLATLFHDFGKLNPNFQPKLEGETVTAYSSHAYLSAFAFFAFCHNNKQLAKELGVSSNANYFSILAMIAHHHGHLPNFHKIHHKEQLEKLEAFLQTKPVLPCSEYLAQWYLHKKFDLIDPTTQKNFLKSCIKMPDAVHEKIADRLEFFQETQFNFGALIEADKRDAGNNKYFLREEQRGVMTEQFSQCLGKALPMIDENLLNQARTQIREEAIENIERLLREEQRVFSLTAPTGGGKTLTLLACAEMIRRREQAKDHVILYSLPFLTITEQVESICRNLVFKHNPEMVTRIDSRSRDEGLEQLLDEIETSPEKATELLSRAFSIETFDASFIITTFVQFFETLLSNRNASIMRLPNFAHCIFLIDEIQALPPRLYIFFTAYLQAFCERFDSYAILSTATMPVLSLPESARNLSPDVNPHRLFSTYQTPPELIAFEKYYNLAVFDRYTVRTLSQDASPISIEELATHIETESCSCLVILNTIDDTRNLYKRLCPFGEQDDTRLLNTRFVLDDRQNKISYCKARLQKGERIVLISTQLIEAGVDIDFPVVYRDLCPLPSIIQSAGRCNRNGDSTNRGTVWFFELYDEGKSRAKLVYRDKADDAILKFSRDEIIGVIPECELLKIQRKFFRFISDNLSIGDHRLRVHKEYKPANLIHHINALDFDVVGSFQLIDEKDYGQEIRYYVPIDDNDTSWEKLETIIQETKKLTKDAKGRLSFAKMKERQITMLTHLRTMSGRTLTLRVHKESDAPPAKATPSGSVIELCGLRCLLFPSIDYNNETGIQTDGTGMAIF